MQPQRTRCASSFWAAALPAPVCASARSTAHSSSPASDSCCCARQSERARRRAGARQQLGRLAMRTLRRHSSSTVPTVARTPPPPARCFRARDSTCARAASFASVTSEGWYAACARAEGVREGVSGLAARSPDARVRQLRACRGTRTLGAVHELVRAAFHSACAPPRAEQRAPRPQQASGEQPLAAALAQQPRTAPPRPERSRS
jgi:hypothetical protein